MTVRRRRLLALALVLTAGTGCDALLSTDDGRVENARVIITGTSPAPLTLITSNQYTATNNAATGGLDVALVHADTQVVSLPLDQNYPIGELARFYVRLGNTDTITRADVRMRVLMDGKQVYDQQAIILDAWLEYVFVYI